MAVTVTALNPAGAPAWDAFAAAHPNGTFFHRAAWADIMRQAFRHTPHYLVAQRDGAVVGVLPLVQVKTLLFGHSLISTPFCVYGGPLAIDAEAFVALEQAAHALMQRLGAPVMEWRFRDPVPDAWLDPGAWQAKDDLYVTFRKAIGPDDDANMKAIPRKQRAMVRKGIDRGLTSTAGSDVDTLHAIYSESVRNLGTPVFARGYFRLLAETFAADMDIIIVRDGDTPVSAVMNFYDRGEVLPYYGGGGALARQVAGHDFLYWEVMRRAAARGCTGFDFGRSKVGAGSFSFKKNWGFAPAPLLHRFRLAPGQSIPDHNPLNPKYALFIKAWKRLPLPIANLIGPHIVRGVG
jgi:FemAB-related protein (PEP-CTERM system-associated)